MASYNDGLKCDVCGKSPAMPVHITSVVAGKKTSESRSYCIEHISKANELCTTHSQTSRRILKRFLALLPFMLLGAIALGIGIFVAGIQRGVRMALTHSNVILITYDFQKAVIENSPKSPTLETIRDAHQKLIDQRFKHEPLDEWGGVIKVEVELVGSKYKVSARSAGADRIFDTKDDVYVDQTVSPEGDIVDQSFHDSPQ